MGVTVSGDRPWIALLGGNQLNAGMGALARRHGARLLVVDWGAEPAVAGQMHVRVDIKDHESVLHALSPVLDSVLFACTSTDVATETVARIHAQRGLQRPPMDALATARHKPSMNVAWERLGLLNKLFRSCRSFEDLSAFRDRLSADIVVKPASGSSSRGVTVLPVREQSDSLMWAAWRRAHANDRIGEVLVEQYIEGTEYSVEMVGDEAGHVQVWGVARKHHSHNAGRNRIACKLHYNPPDLPRARQLELSALARRCYRALGLRSALGHFEVIERDDGSLVPIELGARSSGFIFTHLVDTAIGSRSTFSAAYEGVLHGETVADQTLVPTRSSMYFFYDLPDGVGRRSDTHLMQGMSGGIESLASDRSKLVRGRRFGPIDAECERHGFEILSGPSERLTIANVNTAAAEHGRRFLASSGAPPDKAPRAIPKSLPRA